MIHSSGTPEAAFGRALQTRWFAAPSVASDFDLPAGDNVPTPAAKALFVNRFPRMKNIQATKAHTIAPPPTDVTALIPRTKRISRPPDCLSGDRQTIA